MRNPGLFTAFLLCAQISIQAQALNFSNPSQFHNVEFSISGHSTSSHYHTPLILSLHNNSSETKTIAIEPGQQFIAVDSIFQNFVTTKQEIISLAPGESKSTLLYAMCTERFDHGQSAATQYLPGPMADSGLLLLCEMINKEGVFNYESQTAVWAMLGDIGIEEIVGFDSVLVRNLVELVANAHGVAPPPPPSKNDYTRNYYTRTNSYKLKMGGEFSYKLHKEREIIIAMFDVNDIAVRELYKNEACPPGSHQMKFSFDATAYRDEFYFVRLIENGEIILELEVKTPERVRRI